MSQTPNLTDEQRANLAKLADYLAALPVGYRHFDMSSYCDRASGESVSLATVLREPNCGTVACAAGHGIAAGIPVEPGDAGWFYYSVRAFCPFGSAWDWCFDSDWDKTDNSPHGAAARIWYMLANGVPDDWEDQLGGGAPLSYETEAA